MTNEEQKSRMIEIYRSALDAAWESVQQAMNQGVLSATTKLSLDSQRAWTRKMELLAQANQKSMNVLLTRLPEVYPQDQLAPAASVFGSMLRVDIEDVAEGRRPWWDVVARVPSRL